jgi:hypothetical protein
MADEDLGLRWRVQVSAACFDLSTMRSLTDKFANFFEGQLLLLELINLRRS